MYRLSTSSVFLDTLLMNPEKTHLMQPIGGKEGNIHFPFGIGHKERFTSAWIYYLKDHLYDLFIQKADGRSNF